ncbi:MAG: hypothetical protein DHS20C14_05490 [Phycisphaeraceae bacterium]|nr:MAG: hypothetical protein DHS20C14_05490 [Phycisphaeraceae bacterium]
MIARVRISMVMAACLACAAFALSAFASPGVGDGAVAAPAHAWMVVPREEEGAQIVHLPPRAQTERPAEPGSQRQVRELAKVPVGAAAVGARLYMAFADDEGAGHTVLSGRAVLSVGGLWAFEPVGRLEAHPRVPDGTLLAFVGTDPGPAALVSTTGGLDVFRLGDDGWVSLGVPEVSESSGSDPFDGARLTRLGADPALVLLDGSVWTHAADAWSRESMPPVRIAPGATLVGVGSQMVAIEALDGGGVSLKAYDASGEHALGVVAGVTSAMTASPIALDGGRIALLWRDPDADPPLRVAEVSATTGAPIYEGEPRSIMPVSAGEFRLLAGLLLVVAAAVLLIAVRPSGEKELVLPESAALAEPGRRFAATIVDLLVALFITAQIFRVSVLDIATMTVIFEPGGWAAVPAVLGIGAVLGMVFESAFGRTLGKFLLGCRVVRSDGSGLSPGVVRSVIRNAVKWGLPPIPALALFEPGVPHRGDVLAGAVVIVDIEPEADASAGS